MMRATHSYRSVLGVRRGCSVFFQRHSLSSASTCSFSLQESSFPPPPPPPPPRPCKESLPNYSSQPPNPQPKLLADSPPAGVTLVRSKAQAHQVLSQLLTLRDSIHACDTEVSDIDLSRESPVGHGNVTCVSIYCGPQYDFGSGPVIWVDNLDECEGLLMEFKAYFEDPSLPKVWHNYAFDRHVLFNHGIDCQGLKADTLHLARLDNSSLPSYSLEALTSNLPGSKKVPMKERFGGNRLKKDGTPSLVRFVPDVLELQRNPEYRWEWIDYSAEDARVTWELYHVLRRRLEKQTRNDVDGLKRNMYEWYDRNWRDFAVVLTDMEREGIHVRLDYLKEIEEKAREDAELKKKQFIEWAVKHSPDAQFMNVKSGLQKQHLLFAKAGEQRVFECLNTEGIIEPGKSKPLKNRPFVLTGLGFPVQKTGKKSKIPSADSVSLRALAGYPHDGVFGKAYDHYFAKIPKKFRDSATHIETAEKLGKEACIAIDSLLQHSSINTLTDTFIVPLQEYADAHSRIHCSLNINTETGRLSSRKPNLQNQPALSKDIYKIRSAFSAEEGKLLIVADYSQLELRVLAHLADCKAMISAFIQGGDLHSRTAISMFDNVRKAVESGSVLLERDDSQPDIPLLKDVFADERKKAKALNFSIAYGKTARGLASEWGIDMEAAQALLDLWFRDRPEVDALQNQQRHEARSLGYVTTLLGRRRILPLARSSNPRDRAHALRCAINTPVQGSAADIMMAAMMKLHGHERLRELGWKLVLQIHDEVIMEGPEDSAEEAFEIVRELMEHPLKEDLVVPLEISGSIAKTWFEAK